MASPNRRSATPRPPRAGAAPRRLTGLPGGSAAPDPAALDTLLHHRLRLGMVSALAGVPSLSFVELRGLLATTDGNLSVHARKLEDAGYVNCEKSFADRRPRTEYRLAPAGRRALERYLAHLEALIATTRGSLQP